DAGRVLYISPAVEAIWERPRQSFYDEPDVFDQALHPDDREQVRLAWKQRPDRDAFVIEHRIVRPDGTIRWIWARVFPLRNDRGERVSIAGIATDITERKLAEQALEHQALHDPLTDLPNRSLLHRRLSGAVAAARQTGDSVSLLILDLDHFKEVNDTLGHQWGDVLLQQVGARLISVLEPQHTVARLGGDEFAILLPQLGQAEAVQRAGRILEALEQPFFLEGQAVAIGASVGIAACPEHTDDGETLLRQADVALYVAKRAHGGWSVYNPDEDRHSPGRLALAGELRRAIERDELELFFQPKQEMRTRQTVRLEALLRWRHPIHGLLQPDRFIPLAEQSGLMRLVSWWALNAALRQCHRWHNEGLDLQVAVNLSMRDLHDPQLPEIVAELLEIWELPPDRLTLEITESVIMADPERTMGILERLRALGTPLAADDFGEGYTSLSYLQRLPLDMLKIGKSFVDRMLDDPKSLAIVRSTVELGHNLGFKVVAEGVASQECWDVLAAMGCDMAQGYFVSPPLPADALVRWLRGEGATAEAEER
ncbi:MAG: EAL domain-containing protein, partial [Chloroflexi bacterium]|nr:EAL domain-containing protein [Chloroflexota bacterium]